ncbi:hypothetical protein HK101_001226 [Irineochytrium annulatum]|nr:hypothetical protein HK101_001226 [Irineochytrium annulatum]
MTVELCLNHCETSGVNTIDSIDGLIAVKGDAEGTVPCAAEPHPPTPDTTSAPGVIVPLITGLTTNSKIVKMEKLTVGAPNTTHADEFDYMDGHVLHLLTRDSHPDGLLLLSRPMLPDSAGRILNVSGWAIVSLFGIRRSYVGATGSAN